ncbi:hypothetical protein KOI35_26075 [Actinoplanes bogorensis]|uniref:HEAT repeat domain-containing protein n=1 Tax=Paractinoplanes bogorensis TaxID=1610840 RepID=A0ABS5YU57_9ACTN|nr:hypothetical protein [Actinoplanes bogorensis]MBU2666984.1 hypothetical protein [Actinoplanes bogorensis]
MPLDWSALSHAYGPATDLPDLLRALRSTDSSSRAEAAEQFRARALHQDTIYPATVAAVPFLIELLADDHAPDRTLGHELLADILPDLSPARPHPLGPRLHELAERRSDLYLGRRHEIEPVLRQAHEAVRAGVPTFVSLLGNDDRDARGLSAHLLSFFPEEAPRVVPALTARLAVEPDRVVASVLALTAGMIGDPADAALVAAVAGVDRSARIRRWTVLMGLARLTPEPGSEMLAELTDCLFHGPTELSGWPFHQENPAHGASLALGDLTVRSEPVLAPLLLAGLAAGGEDPSRFLYAVELLLSLAFPDGPRPDDAALTPLQEATARAVHDSGLAELYAVARLLSECNLSAA